MIVHNLDSHVKVVLIVQIRISTKPQIYDISYRLKILFFKYLCNKNITIK
jgi:hypothetical protein